MERAVGRSSKPDRPAGRRADLHDRLVRPRRACPARAAAAHRGGRSWPRAAAAGRVTCSRRCCRWTLPDPALRAPFTELGPTGDLHLYRGSGGDPDRPGAGAWVTAFPAARRGTPATGSPRTSTAGPAGPAGGPPRTCRPSGPSGPPARTADGLVGRADLRRQPRWARRGSRARCKPLVFLRYAAPVTDLHDQVGRPAAPDPDHRVPRGGPPGRQRRSAAWRCVGQLRRRRQLAAGPRPPAGAARTPRSCPHHRAAARPTRGSRSGPPPWTPPATPWTQTVYRAYHLRARLGQSSGSLPGAKRTRAALLIWGGWLAGDRPGLQLHGRHLPRLLHRRAGRHRGDRGPGADGPRLVDASVLAARLGHHLGLGASCCCGAAGPPCTTSAAGS